MELGYFDALADSSFKKIDGQWCFYPWGVLGRGYVIPTEQEYLRIRSLTKRRTQVWLPLVILTGALAGWAWAVALLPVFGIWYFASVRAIAQPLQKTSERLTVGESYRAQARGHSLWMLWVGEIGSIGFVVAGIFILMVDPHDWLVGAASIGFFGINAIAIGFMLVTRLRESKQNL